MDETEDQQLRSATQTDEGAAGGLNPILTFTEEQLASEAQLNIRLQQKMAHLFQRYKIKSVEPIFKTYKVKVTSSPVPKDHKISVTVTAKEKHVPLNVKNDSVKQLRFNFHTFDSVKNVFTVRDRDGNKIPTLTDYPLRPGESYKMKIHFSSDHSGLFEQLLVFNFKLGIEQAETFDVMRLLEVIRQTPQSENSHAESKVEKSFEAAERKPPMGSMVLLEPEVHLGKFPMPQNIANYEEKDMELLEKPLNWSNYTWRFHLLLHLEEHVTQTALNKCMQDHVLLITHQSQKDILLLKASDVKNTSSVSLVGCNVLVTPLNHQEKKEYVGWVEDLDEELIYLKLFKIENSPDDFDNGVMCKVKFLLQRMPLRMQHRAAALAVKHKLKDILFPVGKSSARRSCLMPVTTQTLSAPAIKNNPEQQEAIERILARSATPSPYLIFGPPGTGKTVLLVEVIKQIVRTQTCRILVCAPSNSATDHLCEKILEENIAPHEVFRLYSLSYKEEKIPQNVKMHCSFNTQTKFFEIPSKEDLMRYQIMVTTLQTAGRLVTGGVPPGHYSYIIVDEAGQALETECIIPIAGLLKPCQGQVVLAGDPKQLGPTVLSKTAERNGFGVSLLERLMTEIRLYQPNETNGFNRRFVTKLLRNYRSHPAILKIPNELFYNSELQPCCGLEECLYNNWELLPRKDFPLVFHGVAGMKEQDPNSPSLYNMAEVDVLKEYLTSLISFRHRNGLDKIEPKEIGIVTPYKKQVEKIKAALHTNQDQIKDFQNVLIGTVETFQGKESDVILVSTVRSNPSLTAPEQHFSLGFVKDKKRFNVAMTRARKLLIVVGDPRVLETDPVWNKFIHYCLTERAYRGIMLSDVKADITSPKTESPQEVKPTSRFSWKNQRYSRSK